MAALNPYLNFNGNTEEAFNFYRSVFGGGFDTVMRFKDVPSESAMPEELANKIMHISLPIGNGSVLMGSDIPGHFPKAVMGTNAYISITAASEEEARKLFDGLSDGGNVMMPLDKSFWGALFGMFSDQFGVQWMVSYDYNQK